MPIYMDRHDLPGGTTAKHVAEAHQADIKIQHKFGCKGLTYWFDEDTGAAFCLLEAPDENAVKEMHDQAHGLVPNKIIEVDPLIVKSFLGRIEDPKKEENSEDPDLNIFNDPAFRAIMVIDLIDNPSINAKSDYLINREHQHNLNTSIARIVQQYEGQEVKYSEDYYMASFVDVAKAVLCALEIQQDHKTYIDDNAGCKIGMSIGVSAGMPVSEKKEIFGDTILVAKRLCGIANGSVLVSSEVKNYCRGESARAFIHNKSIAALSPLEEKYLTRLMDKIETIWNDNSFNINDFSRILGMSKSQLYRKTKKLTGKSPNNLIKEIRLNQALKLFEKQKGNVAEIAYETGFNSPAYFLKCFQNRFGILPSSYARQKKELFYH